MAEQPHNYQEYKPPYDPIATTKELQGTIPKVAPWEPKPITGMEDFQKMLGLKERYAPSALPDYVKPYYDQGGQRRYLKGAMGYNADLTNAANNRWDTWMRNLDNTYANVRETDSGHRQAYTDYARLMSDQAGIGGTSASYSNQQAEESRREHERNLLNREQEMNRLRSEQWYKAQELRGQHGGLPEKPPGYIDLIGAQAAPTSYPQATMQAQATQAAAAQPQVYGSDFVNNFMRGPASTAPQQVGMAPSTTQAGIDPVTGGPIPEGMYPDLVRSKMINPISNAAAGLMKERGIEEGTPDAVRFRRGLDIVRKQNPNAPLGTYEAEQAASTYADIAKAAAEGEMTSSIVQDPVAPPDTTFYRTTDDENPSKLAGYVRNLYETADLRMALAQEQALKAGASPAMAKLAMLKSVPGTMWEHVLGGSPGLIHVATGSGNSKTGRLSKVRDAQGMPYMLPMDPSNYANLEPFRGPTAAERADANIRRMLQERQAAAARQAGR